MSHKSNPGGDLVVAVCLAVVVLCAGLIAVCCGEPGPFSMTVVPQNLCGGSIPGQQCVFLVTAAAGSEPRSTAPPDELWR